MQYDKDKEIKHFLCLVLYRDTPFQEKKSIFSYCSQGSNSMKTEQLETLLAVCRVMNLKCHRSQRKQTIHIVNSFSFFQTYSISPLLTQLLPMA